MCTAPVGLGRECLALCAPGATLRALHQLSVRRLSEGLADLGVLPGRRAEAIAAGPYRRFYPHSLGHWLGMDTHDTATVGHDRPLEPGEGRGQGDCSALFSLKSSPTTEAMRLCGSAAGLPCTGLTLSWPLPPPAHLPARPPGVVLTVEPGLYIPDEEEFGHFRGIGVRIEDDVAITAGGHEVLSAAAPVEASEVEELVGTLRPGHRTGVPRP